MRRSLLLLTVFTGGMTTLGVELSASRLLDPFFGNSLIIWAVLIGTVLLYLTVGYYVGGKWADRRPHYHVLYQIVAWASFLLGLVPFVARPVLLWSMEGFARYSAGILAGSLLGVIALFAVPITLLGCVSPFAIRLLMQEEGVEHSGNVAGGLYALSTVGSLVGTFLPVLVLIPNIGTRNTFLLLAFVLLAVCRDAQAGGSLPPHAGRAGGDDRRVTGRADQACRVWRGAVRDRVGLQLYPGRRVG